MDRNERIQILAVIIAVLTFLFGSGIVWMFIKGISGPPAPTPTITIDSESTETPESSDPIETPVPIDHTSMPEETPIPVDNTPAPSEGKSLTGEQYSLQILSFEIVNDYYYEYPDPDDEDITCFLEFEYGIIGNYIFSWDLSDYEKSTLSHSGRLLDANGNEINDVSFWASNDGMFAVEFPANIASGTYVYKLLLYIDGQEYSDEVSFVV